MGLGPQAACGVSASPGLSGNDNSQVRRAGQHTAGLLVRLQVVERLPLAGVDEVGVVALGGGPVLGRLQLRDAAGDGGRSHQRHRQQAPTGKATEPDALHPFHRQDGEGDRDPVERVQRRTADPGLREGKYCQRGERPLDDQAKHR